MDISGVSPELVVQAVAQQEVATSRLEAQVGLVKKVREQQSNTLLSLLEAVPEPQGRSGHNVNLKV
ncbi:hypothetical protein [Marinospirillum perlucidum]|uniref:hypothetical protein n=1 Tax=Marinospirillum perlucidum TaxID=1982602 RepID=UPI000DF13EBC|nr:hypothetical protein [Marinospirillum perlucidum]